MRLTEVLLSHFHAIRSFISMTPTSFLRVCTWIQSRLRYTESTEVLIIVPHTLGNSGTWIRPALFHNHQGIIIVPRMPLIAPWFRVFAESILPDNIMLCTRALVRWILNNSCLINLQWKCLSTQTFKGWILARLCCLPSRFISRDIQMIISFFTPHLCWWDPMDSILIGIISQLHHRTIVSSWQMISPFKSPLVLHAWVACTMYVPCASNPLSLLSQELLLSHGWYFPVCAMMIIWCNGFIVVTNEVLVVLIIIRLISLRVLVMFLIHPLPSWSMTPLVSVRWAFKVQVLIMFTRCMTVSTPPPWSRTLFVSVTGSLHVCVALYINHMWPYPNRPNHNIDNISISIIMKSKNWWQMYH